MKCVNAILTAASCRPMFPMVTPPEKKTHGSQERTNRKSGSVYLVNQNIVAIHNHSSSDNFKMLHHSMAGMALLSISHLESKY